MPCPNVVCAELSARFASHGFASRDHCSCDPFRSLAFGTISHTDQRRLAAAWFAMADTRWDSPTRIAELDIGETWSRISTRRAWFPPTDNRPESSATDEDTITQLRAIANHLGGAIRLPPVPTRPRRSPPALTAQQERALNERRSEVDDLVDGLGLGVDAGIRYPVAVLRLLGYPTKMSCAGHCQRARLVGPWVMFQAPASTRNNLDRLLTEFAAERGSRDSTLVIRIFTRDIFQVQALGHGLLPALDGEEARPRITRYRAEFTHFADWLLSTSDSSAECPHYTSEYATPV